MLLQREHTHQSHPKSYESIDSDSQEYLPRLLQINDMQNVDPDIWR